MKLYHLSRIVLDDVGAGDQGTIAEPHFLTGCQPKPLLHRLFHEVVTLDEEFAR